MAEEIKDELKAKPAAEAAPATSDAAAPAGEGAEGEAKAVRRRVKGAKNVPVGIVHILASFNNTTVSITDPRGNVLSWSSGGRCGFKGSRKSTAYAGTIVCAGGLQGRLGPRAQRSGDPRAGARFRPRVRHPRGAGRRPEHFRHQGHHAGAAQRLPRPQAPPRLTCF
jgi:hypothetical protein